MDPVAAAELANQAATATDGNPLGAMFKDAGSHILWLGVRLCFWMLIKDWLTRISAGISFWFSRDFQPGDTVLLDGETAIIVSIGARQSTFQIREGKVVRWRFVPNHLIEQLKLEKVVDVVQNGHGNGHSQQV